MKIKFTLKQYLILAAFLIPAFVAQAQSYNNIEFIENKGQWDPRVKYMGEVNTALSLYAQAGLLFYSITPKIMTGCNPCFMVIKKRTVNY
ncbi:MAG: hypothetical protein WDO16_21380 [Bacteroidota bacterium]